MTIMIILQYIIAILLFILSIVIHEFLHYLTASYYELNPQFKWIKSKEKHTIGLFGYLPGVRLEIPKNLKQQAFVCLSPIPFSTIILAYFFIIWNADTFSFSIYSLILVICAGLLCSIVSSSADIKDFLFFAHFWNMRNQKNQKIFKSK